LSITMECRHRSQQMFRRWHYQSRSECPVLAVPPLRMLTGY